jgi:Arc/MetJ-type ribon-helix-helix transcriptional regulator
MDRELATWIDGQIKTRRFRDRTHAIEYAVSALMEREEKSSSKKKRAKASKAS